MEIWIDNDDPGWATDRPVWSPGKIETGPPAQSGSGSEPKAETPLEFLPCECPDDCPRDHPNE